MAQRTIIELVSDLSGEELGEDEGRTVNFSYDGVDYTIDLTEAEATEFDHVMEHYTQVKSVWVDLQEEPADWYAQAPDRI